MGLFFVLILYAVVLSVLAAISAVILGCIAFLLTRRRAGRRRAVVVCAAFPFACVAFAGAWFFAYAVINYSFFHRDAGLGDGWETPLPNGYALMMIDVTDEGTVYNPKTQRDFDSVASRQDAVFGVRQLQVSGNHIFGARDSGYFERIGHDSSAVDTWFELDADGNHPVEFKTLAELKQRAASEGITLQLRSFYSVYSEYRFTWFDYSAFAILIIVPTLGLVLLAFWIWRVRRRDPLRSEEGQVSPQ